MIIVHWIDIINEGGLLEGAIVAVFSPHDTNNLIPHFSKGGIEYVKM